MVMMMMMMILLINMKMTVIMLILMLMIQMMMMTMHCIAMMLYDDYNSNHCDDLEENLDICASSENYDEDEDDIGNADDDDDDDVNLLSKVFFCILKLPSHSVFFGRNFTSLKPILPCTGFENCI